MSTSRQRWKRAIRDHVVEVPFSVVDRNPTLVYRLRGEGYYPNEGVWTYERSEVIRNGLIAKYQKERAEAKALSNATTKAKRKAARSKVRVKVISGGPVVDKEIRISG